MTPRLSRKPGLFRSVIDAYVASRQRQADRYVTGALLMLDDETLRVNGYSREDLSRRPNAFYI